jgi:hypothetical protein
MSSVKTKSTLRLLAETILNAVTRVEDQFEKAGLDFPSLEDPFDPSHPTSDLIFKPEVAADVALVVAATEQLAVSIRHPISTSLDAAMSVSCSKMLQCRSSMIDLHAVSQMLLSSGCYRNQRSRNIA